LLGSFDSKRRTYWKFLSFLKFLQEKAGGTTKRKEETRAGRPKLEEQERIGKLM
jgi:hypothetical protein